MNLVVVMTRIFLPEMERVWRIMRPCVVAVWMMMMMMSMICRGHASGLEFLHHETFLVVGMVPTFPGEPHALRFNLKANGTCKLLVSLTPSSSPQRFIGIDHNGGLWRAEEIRFVAVDRTVNVTFAGDPRCGVAVGNVEVGLEDDYVKSITLRTRLACLYALVGAAAVAVSVAFVVGSLRSRKGIR